MATPRGLNPDRLQNYITQDIYQFVKRVDDFSTFMVYYTNNGGGKAIKSANEEREEEYYQTALHMLTGYVENENHLGPIVAKDIPGTQSAKMYGVMNNLSEMYDVCKSGNFGLYELIPSYIPRYFYCDIDCKYSDVTDATLLKKLKKRDVVADVTKAVETVCGYEMKDVVILKSFPDTEKLSLHCIFRDVALRNQKDIKAFSQAVYHQLIEIDETIYSKQQKKQGLGIFDTVPYSSNQVWRVMKQTKLDSPRELKCISGHKGINRLGNVGIYENRESFEYFDVSGIVEGLEENMRRRYEKSGDEDVQIRRSGGGGHWTGLELVDGTPKPVYDETNDFRYLLSCIPNTREAPQNYCVWIAIGMALKNESTRETEKDMRDLWLKWTDKAYKQTQKSVVDYQWSTFKKVKRGFTWRLLHNIASYYVPNPLIARNSKFISEVSEMTLATLSNVNHEVYCKRFVEPYDLDTYDYLLEKSFLGTGKTTALKELLDTGKYGRVLFLSCRIIFSYNVLGEFKDYGFVNYKDCKAYQLNDVDRLICSVESIKRVDGASYDLVIMDEIESILSNLSSSTIKEKEETEEVLESLLLNAKKVVGMDAFMSDRSVDFIKQIRQLKNAENIKRFDKRYNDILVRTNTWKPNQRQAYEYEKIGDFERKILEKLGEGKRVIVYASSYTYLDKLYPRLRSKYNVLFYSAKTGDEVKNNVRDVRNEWQKYQAVLYTPCISVGVNFDVDGVFDSIFCYGVSSSANVRDVFQSLYRVRHISSGELHYYLNDISTTNLVSKQRIYKRLREKNALYKSMLIARNMDFEKRRRCEWSMRLAIANKQEDAINQTAYKQMFNYYLKVCNFWHNTAVSNKGEDENDEDDEEKRGLMMYEDVPDWDQLVDGTDTIDALISKVKNSKATEIEKLSLDKYYLQCMLYGLDDNDIGKVWESYHNSIKRVHLKRLVYEARKQISRLEETEYSKKRGRDVNFINLCYPSICRMLNILGIKNAHDTETTITTQKIDDNTELLRPIIDDLKKKLGIYDQKMKATNKNRKRQDSSVIIKNDISSILGRWNGSKLASVESKRVTKNGERVRVRNYKLQLDDDLNIDYNKLA